MELEKIRFENNVLEFNVEGEDHTYLNLLREQLSQMPEVQFAAYKFLQHERPKFYCRTQLEENPVEILSIASKKIVEQCNDLLNQIGNFSEK
jgi:DNA-directed RNA polymerase subunit L